MTATAQEPTTTRTIQAALAAPFDPRDVKWKPSVVKQNRAMVIAYVSARTVMDRLDEVLGIGNWQASYRPIEGGVVCSLRVRIGGEWSEHEDVGGESEQPDEGDRTKASFSDALKRAAVHIGVGRYLYRLPHQWVDYDPVKKQPTQAPQLPAWAVPKAQAAAAAKPAPVAAAPQKPPAREAEAAEPTAEHLREQIFAEVRRTGRDPAEGWKVAMQWLCSRYPAEAVRYTPKTRCVDIELPRLKELLANLKTHPTARTGAA